MASLGRLQRQLSRGAFVVTAEITPPLSASAERLLEKAAPIRRLVDAVNVTDAAGARVAMSSFAAAALLAREGIDPVLQVTCRDRNRIALAGDLIGAAAQGIENVLVLYGDDPSTGDQPEAKAVHDLDSRAVMRLVRMMRDEGALPSGREITPPPRLYVGAADIPFDPPADWVPHGLLAKAEAGANFVQTQFCFDVGVARRYLERLADHGLTERLAIIIGVGPIASARSARFMNENLRGVTIPDAVVERLEKADDEKAEGRRICIEMIQGIRELPGAAGVHIMAPMQSTAAIAQVIGDAGVSGGSGTGTEN